MLARSRNGGVWIWRRDQPSCWAIRAKGRRYGNATLTAATLLALKLAWRKFFALLAIGRRADDMATSFQLGMLFDHYCAKVHVGAGIDRVQAAALRQAIFGALSESERQALVAAFREGGRVLGRSLPGGAELAERSHPARG